MPVDFWTKAPWNYKQKEQLSLLKRLRAQLEPGDEEPPAEEKLSAEEKEALALANIPGRAKLFPGQPPVETSLTRAVRLAQQPAKSQPFKAMPTQPSPIMQQPALLEAIRRGAIEPTAPPPPQESALTKFNRGVAQVLAGQGKQPGVLRDIYRGVGQAATAWGKWLITPPVRRDGHWESPPYPEVPAPASLAEGVGRMLPGFLGIIEPMTSEDLAQQPGWAQALLAMPPIGGPLEAALAQAPLAFRTALASEAGFAKIPGKPKLGRKPSLELEAISQLKPEHKQIIIRDLEEKLKGVSEPIEELTFNLQAAKEELATSPANRYLDLIPKVGGQKGNIDILTPTQYQLLRGASWETKTMEIGGKTVKRKVLVNTVEIPPGVRDKQGRIRFDYAADELASRLYPEAGTGATDKFREQIIRAKHLRQDVSDFERLVGAANEEANSIQEELDYIRRFLPKAQAEVIAPRTSVQTGLGIGEKPQPVKMLEEFKDIGRKQTLIDEEAIRAREAAKPLPGQITLEGRIIAEAPGISEAKVAPTPAAPVEALKPDTLINLGRTQGNRLLLEEMGVLEPISSQLTISKIVTKLDELQAKLNKIPTTRLKGPQFRKIDNARITLLKLAEQESGLTETGLRNIAKGLPAPIKLPPPAAKVAEAVAPKVAKQPWEMTKQQYIAVDSKTRQFRFQVEASSGEARERASKQWDIAFGDAERNHRASVADAIAEGKPVPAEVLKDYPDLVAKVPTEAIKPRVEIIDVDMPVSMRLSGDYELVIQGKPSKASEKLLYENVDTDEVAGKVISALEAGNIPIQESIETAWRNGWISKDWLTKYGITDYQIKVSKHIDKLLASIEGWKSELFDIGRRANRTPEMEAFIRRVETLPFEQQVAAFRNAAVGFRNTGGMMFLEKGLPLPKMAAPEVAPTPVTLIGEAVKPPVSPELPPTAQRPLVEAPGAIPKAEVAAPGGVPPATISPTARGFKLPDVPPTQEYIAALRQAHPERLKAPTEAFETVEQARRVVLNSREIGENTIAYVESFVVKHGNPVDLFGITPEGLATKVGNPQNRSLAFVDVLENYTHYTLTSQQREIAETLGSIYKAGRELAIKNNIKIGELPALDEFWQYIARKATGRINPATGKLEPGFAPIGAFKMRGKISAQKQRVFEEMAQGLEEGVSYAGPMETLRAYLKGIYRLIGNKQAEKLLLTVTKRGRPGLGERVVSGFVSPQGIGEKYPIWTSRVALADVANAIDKVFVYETAPAALRLTSQTSGAMVGQVAAVDISGPFIQGLNTLGHDISMAVRGKPSAKFAKMLYNEFKILAKPESMDSFRRLHADIYVKAIEDGVITSPFEMVAGTSIAGRVLGKVPVVGKGLQTGYEHIWGRFGKAFSGPLEQARINMYEQLSPAFVAEGRSSMEAAEVANLLTGVVSTKALGVSTTQRMVEQTTLFAPRFFRANLSVMKHLFESGKSASEMRWAVGSLLGSGVAIYTAMATAMGQKPKLNPLPKRYGGNGAEFMTIKIGNNYYGIGGWWYAWTKMLAETTAMAVEDPKALVKPNMRHPVAKFLMGRLAPPVSLAKELATGKDFMGNELRGPEDYLYRLTEGLTPIWSQSLIEAAPRRDIVRAGLEFTGGRTIPLSNLDKVALREHGVTWGELELGQKGLLEKTPEVRKLLAESPTSREQRLRSEARLKIYDQKVEQDKWKEVSRDALGNAFSVKQWRENRTRFAIQQSQDAQTREQLLGAIKERKPKTEKDQAVQGYYKIIDRYYEEAQKAGRGGEPDIESMTADLDKYLLGLSADMEEWLLKQLGFNDTPVDKQFRKDKRVIKQAFWEPLRGFEAQWQQKEIAMNQALIAKAQGDLQTFNRITAQYNLKGYAQAKKNFRLRLKMQSLELDRLLVQWGYYEVYAHPANKALQRQGAFAGAR